MRFILPALLVTLAPPALAQTAAEASVLPRIIDTLCLDLVRDRNGCETAILLVSEEDPDAADLLIFSDRRAQAEQSFISITRAISFNGHFFGQSPSLEQSPTGDLLLHEEQVGIGRTPWTQTLRIVEDDAGLIVAEQVYSTYDRPVGGSFACAVNFETGEWTMSWERVNPESGETTLEAANTGRAAAQRIALSDWSYTRGLDAVCEAPLNEWFNAAP